MEHAPVYVATRFSFLGQSGWKSDFSRDPALLFQPDRLRQRLALFSAVTLPSLAAQSEPRFHHLVLTAQAMPEQALADLTAACLAAYGDPARFTVLPAPPAPARRPLRQFLTARHGEGTVVQVVVDDDDGLASDYMAALRADLAQTEAERPDLQDNLPYFLSYPLGYGLSLRTGAKEAAALYAHRYPFINLGLVLIGTGGGKNIFAIDHLAAPRKFGARLLRDRPMFLRSLHDFNDSRVTPGESWREIPDWQAEPDLAARFPCLFDETAPWQRPAPSQS